MTTETEKHLVRELLRWVYRDIKNGSPSNMPISLRTECILELGARGLVDITPTGPVVNTDLKFLVAL